MNNEIRIGTLSFGLVSRYSGWMLRVGLPFSSRRKAVEVPASADEIRELILYLEDSLKETR
jgi:hypothetical protein